MIQKILAMSGVLVLAGACASTPPAGDPAWEGMSMNELMTQVIDPAANAFWSASGEIDTAEGVSSRSPENEARWRSVIDAARVMRDTGAFLAQPGAGPADPEWGRFAEMMRTAGVEGMAAAEAADADAAFAIGGNLYDACAGCHAGFIEGR